PIVARALSKDPTKRFANCMAFLAALYKARTPARVAVAAGAEPALVGKLPRAKSIDETLENIQLDAIEFSANELPSIADVPEPAEENGEIGEDGVNLGMTIPAPETGCLRPTLIIGVGGFGRKALLELR